MPIASCYISKHLYNKAKEITDLVKLWSDNSISCSEEMTINLISIDQQFGKPYSVIAHLVLPSLWSTQDISLIQLGLSKALASYFETSEECILVTTSIIESGFVVESGEIVNWQ